jgi:hypothetical protein
VISPTKESSNLPNSIIGIKTSQDQDQQLQAEGVSAVPEVTFTFPADVVGGLGGASGNFRAGSS